MSCNTMHAQMHTCYTPMIAWRLQWLRTYELRTKGLCSYLRLKRNC